MSQLWHVVVNLSPPIFLENKMKTDDELRVHCRLLLTVITASDCCFSYFWKLDQRAASRVWGPSSVSMHDNVMNTVAESATAFCFFSAC